MFTITIKQDRRQRDWAFFAWFTFKDEHGRYPTKRAELVDHLQVISGLNHDDAVTVVERFWPWLLPQFTDAKLHVESASPGEFKEELAAVVEEAY